MLVTTVTLFAIGVASVAALEWTNPGTLGDRPPGEKATLTLFQGVTPRTAGFQTVDYSQMSEPSLLVQIGLMFIGTAPTSTGGGIKVTTVALIFLILLAQFRGHQEMTAFGRRLPRELLGRALALISFASALILGTTLVLVISDGLSMLPALFEVILAFRTVGLTLNVTPGL